MDYPPEMSKPAKVFESNICRLTLFIQSPMQADATTDLSLPSERAAVLLLADELSKTIRLKELVMMWSVPMVVTFAEGYLEDAFAILISCAVASHSTHPILDELTGKWIKNTLRSGGPPQWITQLKKFGVTGFPEDLGPKLHKTWELRHRIIHAGELDIDAMQDYSLGERINDVGDFVLTTDAFIVKSYPQLAASA